jgi:protein O-mannosyl-transferase
VSRVTRRTSATGTWRRLTDSPLRLAAGLTFLVATALYLRTLGHQFVWDDLSILMANDSLADWSKLGSNLAPGFFYEPSGPELLDYWRPVVVLSHMIDRTLFAEAAWGPHLVNALLHGATSVLALLLCHAWSRSVRGALAAGLLFAVHPVHVEVVAWVSGRSDLLMGLFAALALWADSRHGQTQGARWQVLALASFALALLSKEAAVVLPALIAARVLLAPTAWSPSRPRSLKGALLAVAPFLAVALLLLGVRFGLLGGVRPAGVASSAERLTLFWTWWSASGLYLELLVWPLNLGILHHLPVVRQVLEPRVWAGCLAFFGLLGTGWRLRGRAPDAAFGVAILLIGLAPLSNFLIPVSRQAGADFPVAERFLYLPSLGFCLVAARLLSSWLPSQVARLAARSGQRQGSAPARRETSSSSERMVLAVSLGLLIAMAARSDARIRDWKSDLTLFAAAVRESPDSYLAHLNYASALAQVASSESDPMRRLERREAARRHYLEAAAIVPDDFHTHYDLGNLFLSTGLNDEAESAYRRALELNPALHQARINLGTLLVRKGDLEGALAQFEAADRRSPGLAAAKVNQAHVLQMLGRPGEAIPLYEAALALQPGLAAARDGLERAKAAAAGSGR